MVQSRLNGWKIIYSNSAGYDGGSRSIEGGSSNFDGRLSDSDLEEDSYVQAKDDFIEQTSGKL